MIILMVLHQVDPRGNALTIQHAIHDLVSAYSEDGGTTAVFTEDMDESDKISGITLCLDIPSPLSGDEPELILDGQVERIVMVYDKNDPKLMESELLELLSNEEKKGTAQFAACVLSET
jgi:hypothetical protein